MLMNARDGITVAACIAVCLLAAFIGSTAMDPDSFAWYSLLNKSSLTPPPWVFAPVWTALYIFMGMALFIMIKHRQSPFFLTGVSLFFLQLVLTILWTFIFFESRNPVYAYAEILILDAVVLIMVPVVGRISPKARAFFLPYMVWLAFATYLNWYVMSYN